MIPKTDIFFREIILEEGGGGLKNNLITTTLPSNIQGTTKLVIHQLPVKADPEFITAVNMLEEHFS